MELVMEQDVSSNLEQSTYTAQLPQDQNTNSVMNEEKPSSESSNEVKQLSENTNEENQSSECSNEGGEPSECTNKENQSSECQENKIVEISECLMPTICEDISKQGNCEPEQTCPNQDQGIEEFVTHLSAGSQPIPSVPCLTFDCLKLITGSWNEFLSKGENDSKEVFLKGCKWSPDGTCLLTNSNDSNMRLFDLPLSLYNCHHLPQSDFPELKSSVRVKSGGLVYDFGWYPLMTSASADSCCFVTSSFRTPVQLWDAYTGELRCSYRGYNLQDELDAALSVTFHPSGDLLLCGYKDNVKIFHTDIPGRDFFEISTKASCEQRGIISCIAVNPGLSNIFAAGTYAKTIGLYSTDGNAICLLTGQIGGLTQLMFSQDGSQLISAGRKDPEILCRDLRKLDKVLWVAKRPHTTNQRIYMDLSVDNRYLLSGSSDGQVYVWDLSDFHSHDVLQDNSVLKPVTQWRAHNDCVNGLSVHKFIPVIATASGQRYIPKIVEDDSDELMIVKKTPENHEDSIKLWWAGKGSV